MTWLKQLFLEMMNILRKTSAMEFISTYRASLVSSVLINTSMLEIFEQKTLTIPKKTSLEI